MQIKERAIILFHGYATDINDLIVLKEELKKRYNYVHLENLPGHGEESIKEFNAIDTMIYCRDVCKKVFAKYYYVDIIGFSMGGAIATYLATQFNFNKIVLLAPANKYLNLRMGISRINILVEYLASSKDSIKERGKITQEFDNVVENDKKALDIAIKQLVPNYTIKSLTTFRTIIDYCNYHLDKKKIDTQTLLIWGEMDQIVPQKVIKYLSNYFTNMDVHILKDISHLMLHSSNYKEVSDIIYDFLDK